MVLLCAVSQGVGRPLIGFYSDRIGRINVAALSSLIASLTAFFLWIFAGEHYAGAIIYSLFGAFAGSIWPCVAPVAVEVMGLQLLPSGKSCLPRLCGLKIQSLCTNSYSTASSHVHHLARSRPARDLRRGHRP